MTTANLVVAEPSSTALSLEQAIGQLSNLESYISYANKIPLLSPEEEFNLAKRHFEFGDLNAAKQLILSHLRLVISTARQYLGYGLPHADLIQEGNIGLMKAVKRFDPHRGVRLTSYAVHWIKAEIHEFVLKNWRIVRVATTKAQRKLFFNLRSLKKNTDGLTVEEAREIAHSLDVKEAEVFEMESRLTSQDIALDGSPDDDTESFSPVQYLADDRAGPLALLEMSHDHYLQTDGLSNALSLLDDRSRDIVKSRWLNDDDSPGATLHELAAKYQISAERVRQIEVQAFKKIRKSLEST